jgi:folate-binding protein YgfZ
MADTPHDRHEQPHPLDLADLSSWPRLRVLGADARAWLHQLITADVEGLAIGRSAPALLLSATGQIRADLTVARDAEGFVLVQTPGQPTTAGELLDRYVLSAEVELRDETPTTVLFGVPGSTVPPELVSWAPSVLGGGADLLAPRAGATRVEAVLAGLGLTPASPAALEARRIHRGRPRLGNDFPPGALPAATGLDAAIDVEKGCFLGQESVARVRNAGHPSSILIRVRSDAAIHAGDDLQASGDTVGTVTSAAPGPGSSWSAIARLAWAARDRPVEIRGHPVEITGAAG